MMLNRNCTDALYQCAALIANTIYESPTKVCLLVLGFDLAVVLWEYYLDFISMPTEKVEVSIAEP